MREIISYIKEGIYKFNYDILDYFDDIFGNKIDDKNGNVFMLPVNRQGVIGNDGKNLSEDDKKFYMFCLSAYAHLNKKNGLKVIICRNKAIENIKKYNIPHFCYFISRILKRNKKWKNELIRLYTNNGDRPQYDNLIKTLIQFKDNTDLLDKELRSNLQKLSDNKNLNININYFSKDHLKKLYGIIITPDNFNYFQKYYDFFKMIDECTWGCNVWKRYEKCFIDILNLIYLKENNNG